MIFIWKHTSQVETLENILGLRIRRTAETITIHQPGYIEQIVLDHNLESLNPVGTPLVEWMELRDDDTEEAFDNTKFRSLLGSLSHLARMSRPDIAQAVFHLATFSCNPCNRHWNGLTRIVQYLVGTIDYGITFSKSGNYSFYVDTDFAGCKNTRKSTTGYILKYCDGPIIEVSRRQRNVTLSSSEAEYCAFTDAVKDILWLKKIAAIFKEEFPEPAILFNDNLTAQGMAEGTCKPKRMRHIDALSKFVEVKFNFIKEVINWGVVKLVHIDTSLNEADIMTKPLARPVFTKHATSLMNINSIIAGCVQNVVYNIDNITSYSMDYVGNENMKY